MIRRLGLLLAVLVAAAWPAWAQVARVISGEHADFTRLVVELPAEAGWTVGRTSMGYAFGVQAQDQPPYDLSRVWQRIPRTRLQAIRVDPDSGSLNLALACDCHVFPFEYRPGMIVLDIRNGPAPPGSVFEQQYDLPRAGGLSASPRNPTAKGYDWLDIARSETPPASGKGLPFPGKETRVSLDPLRDELLEQISRGAVAGVVDMEMPGKPARIDPGNHEDLPWLRITIGDVPGIDIREADDPPPDLTARGEACIPDEQLALADWGAGQSALDLLVEARSGLFGEFDVVKEDAVVQAIRLHLFLGFGAEAAQYAALIDRGKRDAEIALYLSMARLIDGEQDPATPFARMLGCDGTAALWAALAHDRLPAGPGVDTDAIVRSFLALPPHLRRSLGAALAGKLLDRKEEDAARMIRDAMERGSVADDPEVALLDAQSDLRGERIDSARAHAEHAIEGGAEGAGPLIALVEAHFRKAEPIPPDIAEALAAFRGETGDPEERAELDRALALALALSGQAEAALAIPLEADAALSDLWRILGQRTDDDTFLRRAVTSDPATVPAVSGEVALAVASRLKHLGFPEAALAWLGEVGPEDSSERRRLAASAEAARGDARRVLALLVGLSEPEDEALRGEALVRLGRLEEAVLAFAAAEMPAAAERLRSWAGAWPEPGKDSTGTWAAAAEAARSTTPLDAGPLTRGAALLEESAALRGALSALLSDVKTKSP